MISVLKKEFRSVWYSVLGIVVMGLFFLFSGIFFAVYNIGFAYPGAEAVISLTAFPITVLVPLLGCTSYTDEYRKGTDSFVQTLPLSQKDIIFGKYLARAAILGIPTLAMVLYPIILDCFGAVAYGRFFASWFAFVLYQAFLLAFSMMIAIIAKKIWKSFLITYGVLILTSLLPYVSVWLYDLLPMSVIDVMSAIFLFLSPYGQLDYFSTGIFDFRKIIWFVVFTSLSLFISWCVQDKRRKALR